MMGVCTRNISSKECINKITLLHQVAISNYVRHLESKERFAIKKYLLIIGKKQNMQFLSHTFNYFSTVTLDIEALVVPWHQFTYSLLVPEGCLRIRGTLRAHILRYCKCLVTIWYTSARDTSGHCSYTSLIVKCRFSRMMRFTFCFSASVMTEGRPDLSACSPIRKLCAPLAAFITCSP